MNSRTKTLLTAFSATGICMLAVGAIVGRPLFTLGAGADPGEHALNISSTNGKITSVLGDMGYFSAYTREGSEISLEMQVRGASAEEDLAKPSEDGFAQVSIDSKIVNITPINGMQSITITAKYIDQEDYKITCRYGTDDDPYLWSDTPEIMPSFDESESTVTYTFDFVSIDEWHLPTYAAIQFEENYSEFPEKYIDVLTIDYNFTCVEPN